MTPVFRLLRAGLLLDPLAMLVGLYGGVLGHRWGAYVLLGWFPVRLSYHLAIGILSYTSVMGRPWPEVEPLGDWDD